MNIRRGGQKGHHESPDLRISKNLTYLLRHGAASEGLHMDKAGYVRVDEILDMLFYKSRRVTAEKIKEIVENSEKRWYELKTEMDETGQPVLYIRATAGHTLQVEDDQILDKIEEASEAPLCIFATTMNAWKFIQNAGIKQLSKNYIQFLTSYPNDITDTKSRIAYNVFIEFDVQKALKDGMELYLSKNNMIWSKGFDGTISPEYFKKVSLKEGDSLKELNPKEYNEQEGLANADINAIDIEEFKQDMNSLDKKLEQTKISENNKSNLAGQAFKYLVILDFEAQCTNQGKLTVQEIIEFPVVIVDVEKRKILDEKFHHYVKPVVHPQLFPFCIQLTGITQDKVDNGISIQDALNNLDQFLREKGLFESSFCFVTCGNWDLNTCLKKEAQAKNIQVKNYLKQFINLKTNYPVPPQARVRNPDMLDMLKLSKLELIGRHHSGIDDAVNIARVVVYLLENGFKFTKSMVANSDY